VIYQGTTRNQATTFTAAFPATLHPRWPAGHLHHQGPPSISAGSDDIMRPRGLDSGMLAVIVDACYGMSYL
jgi:hypothetical protein